MKGKRAYRVQYESDGMQISDVTKLACVKLVINLWRSASAEISYCKKWPVGYTSWAGIGLGGR